MPSVLSPGEDKEQASAQGERGEMGGGAGRVALGGKKPKPNPYKPLFIGIKTHTYRSLPKARGRGLRSSRKSQLNPSPRSPPSREEFAPPPPPPRLLFLTFLNPAPHRDFFFFFFNSKLKSFGKFTPKSNRPA